MKKKRKNKKKNGLLKVFIVLLLICLIAFGAFVFLNNRKIETHTMFLASEDINLNVLDKDLQEVSFIRGKQVEASDRLKKIDDVDYIKIFIDDEEYYILDNYLADNKEDCVLEKELWVYRTCSIYKDVNGSKLNGLILKGEKIDVIGHSPLKDDGTVERYEYVDGYILSKYLTKDENKAINEDDSNYAAYFQNSTIDPYGAGSASTLDYYPNEKPKFEDNIMPDVCQALYINRSALYDIEEYIDYALSTHVNTFVIDIRDSHIITYASPVMQEYSISSYNAAAFTLDEFKAKVQKCKDAGLYVVARITIFKDSNFMNDHPEYAILDKYDDYQPFKYGGAYWPSAYCREVWEYNVELAKECISDIGFNEIQFDYVRFPEQIDYFADVLDALDLRNKYNETRAEAVQRFLMYASDEIHSVNGYISADVFGETSEGYVCAYGQYWPAISNVVDVISPMPYPDHFSPHSYGIEEYVWEVPYKLLTRWGINTNKQQALIPTPAKIRTYIQGYNSIHEPYVVYDNSKLDEQIRALIDSGVYDGYIVWNAGSYIDVYELYKEALSSY